MTTVLSVPGPPTAGRGIASGGPAMPDPRSPSADEAPEPALPQGLPMPPNTGDMPPPRLPPAPEDDPAPPAREPAPDIDDVTGL